MCWGIPRNAPGSWGGMSTVSLVTNGWMREIPAGWLQPGDAVGICGPGTGGDDGHIVLFERWASDAENESHYWAYEQAGGRRGPVHRVIRYPYDGPTGAWRAYRFRDIQDDAPTQGDDMFDQGARDNLKATDGRTRRFLTGEMSFGDDLDNDLDGDPIWPNVALAKVVADVQRLNGEMNALSADVTSIKTLAIGLNERPVHQPVILAPEQVAQLAAILLPAIANEVLDVLTDKIRFAERTVE